MKKRVLSVLMAVVLMAGMLTGLSATAHAVSFNGGTGTRNDPYLIATAEQLAAFRDMVNGGSAGVCAKLVADIDLGGGSWTPIGLNQTGYTGIFDGCGHLVSNLRIDSVSSSVTAIASDGSSYTVQVGGLFGVVGSGGTVRCVGISGRVTGSFNVSNNTGVYIGSLVGFNLGTVEECFSTCDFTDLTLKNNNYVGIGGLIGISYSGSAIRNCYNTGSISATVTLSRSDFVAFLGGLMGYADGRVENSYAASAVNVSLPVGTPLLGGVFGNAGGNDIYNCYFDNQVCTSSKYVAGSDIYSDSPYDPPSSSGKTTEVLRSSGMPSVLGNAYIMDTPGVNKGYPILAVMTYGQDDENWSPWFEDEAFGTNIDREVFEQLIPAELQNKDLTRSISRLEFCAVAVRLYEEEGGQKVDAAGLDCPFVDTSADVVKIAYYLGITNGVDSDSFDPYAPISREQLATMLTRVYKALNLPGWTLAKDGSFSLDYSGVAPFSDDQYISSWAKPSVYFMVKNEVIKGTSSTTFSPRNLTAYEEAIGYANASREQALIMAVRMFKKL